MFRGGHNDADRVRLVQDFAVTGEARHAELLAGGRKAFGIRIHDADQLAVTQCSVFLCMKSPQVADPDDGGTKRGTHWEKDVRTVKRCL